MSDNFGTNFKRLRKAMGLTQSELAKKLGLQKTTISNYETSYSTPPRDALIKIAQFFNVSVDDLLGAPSFSRTTSDSASSPASMHESSGQKVIKIYKTVSSVKDTISSDNMVDTISFSKKIIAQNCFGVVMPDDSLLLKGISSGDYVIFMFTTSAKNGDIVCVSINNTPALIGTYHETKNEIGIIPFSQNPEHTAKFFSKEDNKIEILGKGIEVLASIK